ncbi:MAG: penicillin-binding protein 1C, partial [Thermoproteota archaeon]
GISKDIQYTFSADEQKQKRVMSKEAAIMTLDVLSKNDRPDELNEYNFYKDQRKVSWKTGTSIGFRDAWSVGLFGPYVVAVWVGNFNGKAHPGLIGSLAAGPLFFEIIDALKPFTPEEDELRYSEKLVEIKVCTLSGKIPSKDCPHKKKALFWTGVSPIDQCNVHRKFTLSQETGLRTCLSSKGRTYDKIYEVWPMPIHNIYRKLKFAQKLPPSFDPLCKLEEKIAFKSRDIKIISPQNGVEYQYREGDKKHDLYFDAWADSDTKSLFWYLDNKFIGKSKNSESFVWNSKPGTYLLQVQDDRGNVALRTLKVNLIE